MEAAQALQGDGAEEARGGGAVEQEAARCEAGALGDGALGEGAALTAAPLAVHLPPWLAGAAGAALSPLAQPEAGGAQSWPQAQATGSALPVPAEPADGAWRCLDRSHAAACARCAAGAQPPAAALLGRARLTRVSPTTVVFRRRRPASTNGARCALLPRLMPCGCASCGWLRPAAAPHAACGTANAAAAR
jgi:hypothetical protein